MYYCAATTPRCQVSGCRRETVDSRWGLAIAQINPLRRHTTSQARRDAEAKDKIMPMEIIVSGPSCANRVRLRDTGNSLMTPDPVLYRLDAKVEA